MGDKGKTASVELESHQEDEKLSKLRPEEEDEDDVQHASDIIGQWGPLQRNVVIFYIGIYVIAPFQNIGIAFYTPKVDFWCKRPPGFENATLETCNSYENSSLPCTEWEYDMSFYRSTLTNEFNLVCSRQWLASMSASVYQIGYAVSSVAIGILSDRKGRLVAFKVSIIIELVAGLSQSFAMNIEHFLFSRLFLGIGAFGRFLTGMLLIIELVGPNVRDKVQVGIEAGWCLGYLLMPLVNYVLRHFRYVQLAIFVYEALFLVGLWKLPESPRWQLTHGQFDEAEKTIFKAARMRGKVSEDQVRRKLLKLKAFVEKEDELRAEEAKKSIVDLWKVPSLLKYCLTLYFVWFSNAFVYYGFAYNVGSIGGSIYWNVFLQALGDTFVVVVLYYIINRFPRRKLGMSIVFAGSLATFAIIPFTFKESGIPFRMVLAMVGKLCISGAGHVKYLLTAEIFPTTLRQIGVGSCSVVARVGSTMAPFVKELANATHVSVMMALLGALSAGEGLMIMLLPETRGREIPDTIEEARARSLEKKKSTN